MDTPVIESAVDRGSPDYQENVRHHEKLQPK